MRASCWWASSRATTRISRAALSSARPDCCSGLLGEAGLPAAQVYITNAVKHFYFQLRGKRRIHKTPLQRHVAACHDWLERELAQVDPGVIVTLGATALAAVLGRRLAIAEARG